jgi:hypothetical protein
MSLLIVHLLPYTALRTKLSEVTMCRQIDHPSTATRVSCQGSGLDPVFQYRRYV